ncbi:MAG: hypothetical protein NTW50_04180 [Candidatus Berkelbacteria bacterium]|nr:hypothetical protein [Candidatus Berkelbacteria bacterium]
MPKTKKDNDTLPEWAEELGDDAHKEWDKMAKREKPRNRHFRYVVAVIINAVLFWFFNNLANFHIPFLAASYTNVLFVLNLSIGLTILANLLLIIHDGHWFRGFLRLIQHSLSLVFVATLYVVFPFDFSVYQGANFDSIVHILLLIGIVGTAISIIVEFFRMLLGRDYHRDRQ